MKQDPRNAEKKESKYRNKRCEYDGYKFPSEFERDVYIQHKYLQMEGKISNLKVHEIFFLSVKGVHICEYEADLSYLDNGELVVKDAKGFRTKEFIIKKKLMKACLGIEIIEVRKKEVKKESDYVKKSTKKRIQV